MIADGDSRLQVFFNFARLTLVDFSFSPNSFMDLKLIGPLKGKDS